MSMVITQEYFVVADSLLFVLYARRWGIPTRTVQNHEKHLRILAMPDLGPEDLHHTLNHVKEGDLQDKLNNSMKVPQDNPGATSSSSPPSSIITADQPYIPSKNNSNKTHTPKPHCNNIDTPNSNDMPNSNMPNDQPTHTINTINKSSSSPSLPTLSDTINGLKVYKMPSEMHNRATSVAVSSSAAAQSTASVRRSASSSSSRPSQSLRDTLSTLKTAFNQPSEMESIVKSVAVASFGGLARGTQSATAQSTASICDKEASAAGFLVQLNGQVVKPKPAVPQTKSFGFSLKPARSSYASSVPTTSTWSDSYQQAIGIHHFGSKCRDPSESDEDYDIPLSERLCKRIEDKSVVSSPDEVEEDSVKECLHGNSVFDPLVPKQIPDNAILAPEAVEKEQPVIAQDAPAANMQPNLEAMSSPERVDNEPSQDASTSASPLSCGTNYSLHPSCRSIFLIC